MAKRLPGLVIEVEDLPGFLTKPDEDILQHVRAVLLHRAYAVQRAQLAKCDGGRTRGQAVPWFRV
jgi:hypothetical protein